MRLTITRMRDGLLQNLLGQFQASAALAERLRLAVGENAEEVARHFGSQDSPDCREPRAEDLDRLRRIFHAVDERIGRIELLARFFDIGADGRHLRLRFGAGAALQSPAAEQQHAGFSAASAAHRHHGGGIVGIAQFALEDFGPEVVVVFRQVLQAQTAVGTEVVVGDELVGLVGALLFLGAVERLGDDDFVLFVEILAREHDLDDVFLELVGEFLDFGVAAAGAATAPRPSAAAAPPPPNAATIPPGVPAGVGAAAFGASIFGASSVGASVLRRLRRVRRCRRRGSGRRRRGSHAAASSATAARARRSRARASSSPARVP